jgi:hypothetical protein
LPGTGIQSTPAATPALGGGGGGGGLGGRGGGGFGRGGSVTMLLSIPKTCIFRGAAGGSNWDRERDGYAGKGHGEAARCTLVLVLLTS